MADSDSDSSPVLVRRTQKHVLVSDDSEDESIIAPVTDASKECDTDDESDENASSANASSVIPRNDTAELTDDNEDVRMERVLVSDSSSPEDESIRKSRLSVSAASKSNSMNDHSDADSVGTSNLAADASNVSIALEDDDEDARIEARCFSPRTRQSLGIGRQDLLTDSDDEVPETDDDSDAADDIGWTARLNSTRNQSLPKGSSSSSTARTPFDMSNQSAVADESDVIDVSNRLAHGTSLNKTNKSLVAANVSTSSKHSSTSNDVEIIPNAKQEVFVLSSDEDIFSTSNTTAALTPPKPKLPPQLVQAKITAFTPTRQQLKYVSAPYMAEQQKKRWDIQAQLQNSKKLLGTLQDTLPDKGAGLRVRLQRLADELTKQDQYIATLRPDQDRPVKPAADNADDWSKISAAINAIQPVHTGNQGLNTFNTQKALTVERLQQLHASLETCPTEDTLAPTPKGMRVELMEHQRYALSWMVWRERQKPRGGILADDMGLGKTLTVISLVLAMNQRDDDRPEDEEESSSDSDPDIEDDGDDQRRKSLHHGGTLVVCPASLINQWEGEVTNRLRRNQLNVVVHHGLKRDVRAKYLARNDIVITTYAIVAREHADRAALFGIRWARIILDEAHVIRNHKSKQSEACTKLSGSRRWALTGTPIQNKEMDIYAQLRFLRCTPFDDLLVYKKWIGNQSTGNQERMNKVIQPMMLRRTKAQLQEKGTLLGMPSKTVQTVRVQLDKVEMNVYQRILTFSKTLFSQFLHQRAERQNDAGYRNDGNRPPWERNNQPNEAYDRMHQRVKKLHGQEDIKSHQILTYILRLRQICCHPGLIDVMLEDNDGHSISDTSASLPEVDLLEQLNKMNLNEENAAGGNPAGGDLESSTASPNNSQHAAISKASSKLLMRSNPVFDSHRASSKFRVALKLLEREILPAGDKAVVVSQWTSVLALFREHLDSAGMKYVQLTGAVAVKDRNGLVVEFNQKSSGVQLMLLSLTAGGVGLNLTGANHLLLLDPHWNPQLEAQAQDRVYRVGQTKAVQIYKFLCADTIEERISKIQELKLSMATDMLNGVKHTGGSKLTIDDMKALFDM